MQLTTRTSSGIPEYAPANGPPPGKTHRERFIQLVGYHDNMKLLPERLLWAVDVLLGVAFALSMWGFIQGLVRCWSAGQW